MQIGRRGAGIWAGGKGQEVEGKPLEGMLDMTENRCWQQAGREEDGSEGYLSLRIEQQKSNKLLSPEGRTEGGEKSFLPCTRENKIEASCEYGLRGQVGVLYEIARILVHVSGRGCQSAT